MKFISFAVSCFKNAISVDFALKLAKYKVCLPPKLTYHFLEFTDMRTHLYSINSNKSWSTNLLKFVISGKSGFSSFHSAVHFYTTSFEGTVYWKPRSNKYCVIYGLHTLATSCMMITNIYIPKWRWMEVNGGVEIHFWSPRSNLGNGNKFLLLSRRWWWNCQHSVLETLLLL